MVGRSWETGRQVLPMDGSTSWERIISQSGGGTRETERSILCLENWRQAYDNLGLSTLCEAWLALDSAPRRKVRIPRPVTFRENHQVVALKLCWSFWVPIWVGVRWWQGSFLSPASACLALLFRPAKICSAAPIVLLVVF